MCFLSIASLDYPKKTASAPNDPFGLRQASFVIYFDSKDGYQRARSIRKTKRFPITFVKDYMRKDSQFYMDFKKAKNSGARHSWGFIFE